MKLHLQIYILQINNNKQIDQEKIKYSCAMDVCLNVDTSNNAFSEPHSSWVSDRL